MFEKIRKTVQNRQKYVKITLEQLKNKQNRLDAKA